MEQAPFKLEVSHALSNDQLKQISDNVFETIIEAIESARKASKVDSDILSWDLWVLKKGGTVACIGF